METPCRYPSEGHQHGDRKRFETSVFKLYFFFKEIIKTMVFILRQGLLELKICRNKRV